MRIIAGALKNCRLATPTWAGIRPTSERLRETLFNILATRVAGARVLDGFAGTGALGLEARSRGAAHVTFVECDRRAAALIAENLRRCRLSEGCVIMRRAWRGAAAALGASPRFDLILIDPPYEEQDDLADTIRLAAGLLAAGGVMVVEHARRRPTPAAVGGLIRTRDVRSGDSALAVYTGAVSLGRGTLDD